MKLSVSLTDADVALVDRYAADAGLGSRSAAIQEAIRRLPRADLSAAYESAWDEWAASGDAEAWEGTTADGLPDASR